MPALPYKVYAANGEELLAATAHVDEAAMIVSASQWGTTIRHGHSRRRIVWKEGEFGEARFSYDFIVETIHQRVAALPKRAVR